MELEELLKTVNTDYTAEIAKVQQAADARMAAIEAQLNMLGETVKKAMETEPREGVGRKGTVADPREANPLEYIVQKARKPEEMTAEDKALAWGIFYSVISAGMQN